MIGYIFMHTGLVLIIVNKYQLYLKGGFFNESAICTTGVNFA